jgi:hypothetical protein
MWTRYVFQNFPCPSPPPRIGMVREDELLLGECKANKRGKNSIKEEICEKLAIKIPYVTNRN